MWSSRAESCSLATGGDCHCGRNWHMLPLVYSAFVFCADSLTILFTESAERFGFRFPCQSLLSVPNWQCRFHSCISRVCEHGSWRQDQCVFLTFPFISSAICMSRAPLFLSWSLLACLQHQSDSLPISTGLLRSFPALVFTVSQICFKDSLSYLSALKTNAFDWKNIITLQEV